jgi:hypothetical protein
MGGDTGLLNPGDRVGGNIADDEASVLLCCCQLSCIHIGIVVQICATTATYIEDIRRVDDMLPLPHEKPL